MKKHYVVFIILFLSLVWAGTALANSYLIPFLFAHQLTSQARYFGGQNIAFEASPITYPDPEYPNAKPKDNTYKVTLFRYIHWLDKDKIGTAILPRNSFGKAVWTNVGPGNYYIFFEKEKDRMIVDDDGAKMYDY